jgi:cholesterol transport system auxiliary component
MRANPLHVWSIRVIAPMLAAVLASCTLDRAASVVPTSYDLGPAPAYARSNPAIVGTLLIPPVRAPAWLDETSLVYRLLYEDSSRPRVYAMSRWSADPASLVTDRLRSRFAAASGGVVIPGYSVASDYTLRVELDDFSQRFDAPDQSRASLSARATLLSTLDRKLIAQRVFDYERPAAANASGAVKALTEATDEFLEALVKWAAQSARLRGEPQTKP